jgi:hypothetical protein
MWKTRNRACCQDFGPAIPLILLLFSLLNVGIFGGATETPAGESHEAASGGT